MIQAASGSHAGAPDGTESPGIDQPWQVFATGMHLSTSPVDFLDPTTLDFSGWGLHTGGLLSMLSDPVNFADTQVATISCDTTECSEAENFTLDYVGHIPLDDASGFGGTKYHLVMNGVIVLAAETDKDSIPNYLDNCPYFANTDQLDTDSDGTGDACENDTDNDGLPDGFDNCPFIANTNQLNSDADLLGNVCDDDDDNDGVVDTADAFPLDPAETIDTDNDGIGNNADSDDDNDGLSDIIEQSIGTNTLLADSDLDGLSDYDEVNYDGNPASYIPGQDLNPLSEDSDGDGITDSNDPIPLTFNFADGDLAPLGNPDGIINVADKLIAIRLFSAALTATELELSHGDVYPVGAPDGVIDMSDVVLIVKSAP